MYSVGYCKNGPMCKFIHIKKDENGNKINEEITEKIKNDDDTSSTPYDEDSITISNHRKKEEEENEKDNNEEESINNKIIPIWYLEHYYDKPISSIFSEIEL